MANQGSHSRVLAALFLSTIVGLPPLCGCAYQGAQFDTKVAPDFSPAGHTISVLGVYKDGQMSSEAWVAIGQQLASWLGPGQCEVGYGTASAVSDGALVAAINDYALANGPTDDLLTQLAPAARGDLILTVTLAGKPPVPAKISVVNEPSGGAGGGPMGGGRRGGAGAGSSHKSQTPTDTNRLDAVASLFSVSQGHEVAEVAMEYSGDTVDDALSKFARKLASTLPGSKCTGWDWKARVDLDRIRQSAE